MGIIDDLMVVVSRLESRRDDYAEISTKGDFESRRSHARGKSEASEKARELVQEVIDRYSGADAALTYFEGAAYMGFRGSIVHVVKAHRRLTGNEGVRGTLKVSVTFARGHEIRIPDQWIRPLTEAGAWIAYADRPKDGHAIG
jgi:hypothetical protein